MKPKTTIALIGVIIVFLNFGSTSSASSEVRIVHTVAKGQTLGTIARYYRIPAEEISKINPAIRDNNLIGAGQKVVVQLPGVAKAADGATTYRIRPGDTLGLIGAWFNVPPDQLAAANRIANPHAIRAGGLITIPAPKPAPEGIEAELASLQKTGFHRKAQAIAAPYQVAVGESLAAIAAATKLPIADLKRHNTPISGFPDDAPLPVGTELNLPYPPLILRK